MGKTLDVEEFLSWLNETEEELKGERADELNPDRKDEGILLTTETVRKYVESMCKIDDADSERGWIPVTERLPEYERDVLLTLEAKSGSGYRAYSMDAYSESVQGIKTMNRQEKEDQAQIEYLRRWKEKKQKRKNLLEKLRKRGTK